MPIGLLTDDEFEKELSRFSKTKTNVKESHPEKESSNAQAEIVNIEKPGRKEGDVNVPDSLRAIIGETSVIDGRRAALRIASEFGISPSSVSAYANGATSTASYDAPSKSISGHIHKSKERAVKRASKTLNSALSSISQEKLDYTDAVDLSSIAKNMSVIIKNLEPEKQNVEGDINKLNTPQFVIFAPQFRSESSFEVIDVKE